MAERELTVRARVEADDAQPIDDIEASLRGLAPAGEDALEGLRQAGKGAETASKSLRDVEAQSAGAAKGLRSAGKRIQSFVAEGLKLGKVKDLLGGIAGTIDKLDLKGAVGQISQLIGLVTEASRKRADALNKLEGALRSTGKAATFTRAELVEMADGLEKVSTASDEVVIESQAVLLHFEKVGKEVFPAAIEGSLNLATALGQDVPDAAKLLGKALDDPIKGLSGLTDAGFQFSKSQIEAIEAAAKAGKTFDAQKIILAELEKRIGGAARAARESWTGAMAAASNASEDFLQKVGEGGLTSALERLATSFTTAAQGSDSFATRLGQSLGAVVEVVGSAITGIQAGFSALAGAIGIGVSAIAEPFVALGATIGGALSEIPGLESFGSRVKAQLGDLAEVLADFRRQTQDDTERDLRAARASLEQTIENIVGIFTEGGKRAEQGSEGFQNAAAHLGQVGQSASSAAAAVQASTDQVAGSLSGLAPEVEAALAEIQSLFGQLPEAATTNVDAFRQAWESFDPDDLRARLAVVDDETLEKIKAQFASVVKALRGSGGEISEELKVIGDSIGVTVTAFDPVAAAAGGAADAVSSATGQIADSITVVVTKYDEAGNAVESVEQVTREAAQKMTLHEIEAAGPRLQEYVKRLKEADGGLGETATKAQETAESLADPAQKVQEVSQSVGELAGSSKTLADAQQNAGQAAKDQATSLGELAKALTSQDLAAAVADLAGKLEALNQINLGPLLGQLDAVEQKAKSVAQAVASIDEAADSGATGEA